MEIITRKATPQEWEEMQACPVWECGISEFDWHYDELETALVLEGAVTVFYEGKSISFGAGEYVQFPAGLSCVWKVTSPVKKRYRFG